VKLATLPYLEQLPGWPAAGRHILAHFDEETLVVYQAYRPSIGRFALEQGFFGGPDFRPSRMSWIKPNFLWMMYRSGWGEKQGQEVVLGVRIRRSFFDAWLASAVPSTFWSDRFTSQAEWRHAISRSDVRLQWDPDHHPSGAKVERRALQLGLRGEALAAYAGPAIVEIIDMSAFVADQRPYRTSDGIHELRLPIERVYEPALPLAATNAGLTHGKEAP
jgi:hypothetical protein